MGFFTLFSGAKVDVAPDQKIIPAKEFSTIKKAADILKKTKAESLEFKKEAAKEAEIIKANAAREGFEEGLVALNEQSLKMDAMIKSFESEMAKKLLPIALKAAKKILGEELRLHPDRILDIVQQVLKPVTEHHKVQIYVNKADLNILEQNKSKFKDQLNQAKIFSIQERSDIEPGGCIIESEAGIINAQLENQWRALEKAFEKMRK